MGSARANGAQERATTEQSELATLATILAGQGEANGAAGIAGQMLDRATGMESCRIQDRVIAVRDAVTAVSDGAAATELAEPTPGISTSVHHLCRGYSATRIGEPQDDFESSRIEWVPLATIPGLIDTGQISSATTLAALLYTLAQDTSGSR
ncbi:MAG: hypothetical protein ACRDOH_34920 [Streptosporangiaceae bacterium]